MVLSGRGLQYSGFIRQSTTLLVGVYVYVYV
jgi:hypothetical protein